MKSENEISDEHLGVDLGQQLRQVAARTIDSELLWASHVIRPFERNQTFSRSMMFPPKENEIGSSR